MIEALKKSKVVLVCLGIALATMVCYWQVQDCAFLDFDDNIYVTENPTVKAGLNLEGVRWAFNFVDYTYWHPLTWLSHMMDCELFGLNPAGHHATNVLFHLVNSLLVFLVLRRMTGAVWRSALVGALFAVHPLQVESVAWITERKNVLSTFFWMLTMGSYVWYGERPGIRRYLLVLFLFVLGLMSKPMLVTLPFVLLLMDYWPLGRFRFDQVGKHRSTVKTVVFRLLREKIPFLVFSTVSIYVSQVSVQHYGGAVVSTEMVPMNLRIANAIVSYVQYIGKILWPHNLAIVYPYPGMVPGWQVMGALVVLAGISLLVVWKIREKPFLAVGWLWYVGTLVPVIGIVQAGLWPAIADRFTYVPSIGLSLMLVWGIADIVGRWRYRQSGVAIPAMAALLGLMACTYGQVAHWKDTTSLFDHSLRVTENNYPLHFAFGSILKRQGKDAEALDQFAEVIRIRPNFAEAHFSMGSLLASQERTQEATFHLTEALRFKPDYADAHNNLGVIMMQQGKPEEAARYFGEALRIETEYVDAHYNLGNALFEQGKLQEAISHYEQALDLNPDHKKAHYNWGVSLENQGKLGDAVRHYIAALRIAPDFVDAHSHLATILQSQGKIEEALNHYAEAARLNPDFAEARYQVGTILSQQGKLQEAAAHLSKAVELTPSRAEAHLNLGITLGRLGKLEQAAVHLSEALRIVPFYAKAHNNLGVVLRLQGKLEEASENFQQALMIDPRYTDARNNLDACLRAMGKTEKTDSQP